MRQFVTTSLVVLALGAAFAERADAGVTFGAIAGYGRGTLTREAPEALGATMGQGYIGYAFTDFNLHGFFQHMDVSFKSGKESYRGIYSVSGVGMTLFSSMGRAGRMVTTAQAALTGSMVVLSESSGTINDTKYIYSTLSTLTGTTGVQAQIGYERIAVGRMESKAGERAFWGFYLSYLSQGFLSQKTKIKTNNSVLSPQSPGTEAVSYSVNLIGASVGFNYQM